MSAIAQAPSELWTRCETGTGAGQCSFPRGIAANPRSGHVFIADQSNFRVDEFTARGQFVKTWGWDVVQGGSSEFEICVPAEGETCKEGTEGTGAGQFGSFGPQGVAVDSAGDVYVVDFFNHRVEKFDSEGNFLQAFGSAGTGIGQFSWSVAVGSFIAIDTVGTDTPADDKVYVGDVGRIQRFDTSGVYQAEIPLPGKTVQSLAVDTAGNLYAVFYNQKDIHKLDPVSGEELGSFAVKGPTAVAVDAFGHVYVFGSTCSVCAGSEVPADPIFEFAANGTLIANFGIGEFTASTGLATNFCPGGEEPGNLYVSNSGFGPSFVRAYGPEPATCGKAITLEPTNVKETAATLNGKANPGGEEVSECLFEYGTTQAYDHTVPCAESAAEIGEGSEPVPVHAEIAGLTKGTVYHVRLVVGTAAGSEAGSDETFKTLGPPVLSGEGAFSVAYTEATLKALVNPEGFPTSYHFEYGTDASYGQSTTSIEVGSPGDRSEHHAQANLTDLEPGTTYHWRIVAANSSGPAEGEDQVFTTYSEATASPCSNDVFRTGPGAALPDCRAYEMVSPVDKNGGDVEPFFAERAVGADKVVYIAKPAFGDAQASVSENYYLASRNEKTGWSNHAIHPPKRGERPVGTSTFGLGGEFLGGFSPDLCSGWFLDLMTPSLTAEGQEGFLNYYRVDLCGEEAPEAATNVKPPEGTSPFYVDTSNLTVVGHSADGRHTFFVAAAKLTERAAANTSPQIYDHFCPVVAVETCKLGGTASSLHLVSIKPDGSAETTGSAVGSTPVKNIDKAVSEDGSRVFWTSFGSEVSGTGRIFLREHPERDGAGEGECETRSQGCTVAVTKANSGVDPSDAFFWTAASDGSAVLYSEPVAFEGKTIENGLFVQRFEESATKKLAETKLPRELLAEHVEGVMGASEDLARIYFVSTDALAGEAKAGAYNLYLDEGGTTTYVATLIAGDVGRGSADEEGAYDVASNFPRTRAARVSPDGAHIVFESRAPLTGFDNTDPASGEPLLEVFTYEAGGALACVSCNPSGARPSGRELVSAGLKTNVFASAWIPGWADRLYASHVLSEDGDRVFFNSYEALLPADTNGAMDVYEWEAPGSGSCTQQSTAFQAASGGCLYLISSGASPTDSRFAEASADGSDVFFSTESSLLPQDPGLVDLYDARVEGGFPQPPPAAAPCEGEACQSPPISPSHPTPASRSYNGPGNLSQDDCGAAAKRADKLAHRAKEARQAAKRAPDEASGRRLAKKARRYDSEASKLRRSAKRCRRAERGAQR